MSSFDTFTGALTDLRMAAVAFALASMVFFVTMPPPTANAHSGTLDCAACLGCPPGETPVPDSECQHCSSPPPPGSAYCSCCADDDGNAKCCWESVS